MKLLPRIASSPGSTHRPFRDDEIEQSIPQRFEQQVRARADHLAIRWDRGSYTYASLNQTANRLARTIRDRRGDSAEPIALLFDHGGEVLAAIMAVLKAGKFYVALDASYPPDRLRYMLEDSGAQLMVADANNSLGARQLAGDGIDIVDFTAVDPALSDADLGVYPAPGSLALLLYTSGSSGRPKGAMHTHRSILADVRNFTNGWSLVAEDRWLLYTSVSFANSVRTVYSSLMNGGSVFPYDVRKNGFGPLTAWLQDNEITIVRGVATTLRNFLEGLDDGQTFPAARVLSIGGEPMLRTDLDQFNRHFLPHCVLAHGFGPTECLTVCWALVAHGTRTSESKLPIGHSLPDKDVLLLDESRREVGAGEVGEIAVRSRYISLGYWRDPERTAAAFLPDPADSDARIYLTGDLGMRSPEGHFVHVGRRDFQVKIRGFRVEVTEIETALRAVAGIREAVVVGREVTPGAQRLIAYFVAATQPPIPGSRIREELARTLPDYMIPAVFVSMDAIPQTPNGKTDRLRLPLPARDRRHLETPFVAPRTAIETELAAMWASVLGVDQVGIEDRFLDLGGDSLQAARIVTRVSARYQRELPVGALFDARTVAQMANVVAAAVGDAPGDGDDVRLERRVSAGAARRGDAGAHG